MKQFINYALVFAVIIAFTSCGKKQTEQSNTVKKDTVITAPKTTFDVKTVSKENLPQNIKEYIATNYKEYKINEAASDPLCGGGDAIDVMVEKTDKTILSLIFKPDGTYVQKEEDIPFKDAPAKVKEVIKTKYSSYKAGDQIEKLTLANNTIQYLIDIEKDKVSKEVILTAEGQLVCEN